MKKLLKTSIVAGLPILLFSGGVFAGSDPQVNPVKSGILVSVDKSDLLEFDEEGAVTNLGYPNVSGGGTKSEAGWSLGYRKAFGSRWSLDTKYVRQNATSKPLNITVNPDDAKQAAQAISKALPKLSQGISVGLLHHLPISHRASTHFGGGAFIWRGKRETSIGAITATHKEDGVDPMLQLGLTYRLTPSIAVTSEVQRFFKSEDEDIRRYSLGLVYSF